MRRAPHLGVGLHEGAQEIDQLVGADRLGGGRERGALGCRQIGERRIRRDLDHEGPARRFHDLAAEPGEIFPRPARIHHQTKPFFAEQIHDQVVDHPARMVEHAGIERAPRLAQLVHIVGEGTAQKCARAVAVHIDGEHVRDVEHPGIAPHRVVFLDLGAVVDRHVPAAEIDHARPQGPVGGVERGGLEHVFLDSNEKGATPTSQSTLPLCP